ncbi:MAG: DNA polymerase beta-like region [Candidatus Saganbacteria bacterium]|uniref:DNA polymerase beta-like region n=1 Tax=Candidatus Saganbacteria bacterium TaxID=2575572 RepID=A0A833L297_UNCSA|nr:MAG: DNA polymerase beta-like region [Candidatus Saganbacteria bacterium]
MPKRDDIKKLISQYIKSISQKIPINKVILFGSYATGNPNKYSDIDLAVISSKFSEKTHLKDLKLLWTEAAKINSKIEPLPFSTEETKNTDSRSFLGNILKNGKVVYK